MRPQYKILLSFVFAVLFSLGFTHPLNPPAGGWYQQFMPNLNGASIRDITFTDSLKGYAVTSIGGSNSYILKTTNGGDNWTVKFLHTQPFVRVIFINSNTGFTNAFTKIFKTTNGGENWNAIDLPSIFGDDMSVLNEDTIWLAMSESLTGGVYWTTNGGVNWEQRGTFGSQNPNKIYMFNGRIGFITQAGGIRYVRRTTNSGLNWTQILTNDDFLDIYFVDSLTGWKSSAFGFKKTTDGGLNWVTQTLPGGGYIQTNPGISFSNINRDTIWSSGGYLLYPNNQTHGFLNRTTNGGNNWLFQVPDTSLQNVGGKVNFVNKLVGWATSASGIGIHTTTGGNDTFYTPAKQISSSVPREFKLYQNYPNPFNPKSNIKYEILEITLVKLEVFDISGKLVSTLVNQKQSPGEYTFEFDGSGLSSGVYFYSLYIDEELIGTKKMILLR